MCGNNSGSCGCNQSGNTRRCGSCGNNSGGCGNCGNNSGGCGSSNGCGCNRRSNVNNFPVYVSVPVRMWDGDWNNLNTGNQSGGCGCQG